MTTPEQLAAAEADLQTHADAYEARRLHDGQVREHAAAKPRQPSTPRPVAPTGERPTADQVRAAEALCLRAARADGEVRAADKAIEAAEKESAAANEALVQRTEDKAHAVRLLAACRRAPGDEAAATLTAMGDVGELAVAFAGPERGKNDPYVTVSLHGVEFDRLSHGEQVLADLLLRAGLRRSAKLGAVQIVIDDAQSWTGEWPEIEGGSVWLWTEGVP